MESLIEDQRAYHEERDRLVDTMTREWMHEKRTNRERINSDHRIKILLERYVTSTHKLHSIYTKEDAARQTESRSVGGPNEFAEFYARLKSLKESHRKTGQDTKAQTLSTEFNEMNIQIENPNRVDTEMVVFSGEEGYGKFLDMNEVFQKFLNLKGIKRTDYLTWLGEFDQLYELNKTTTKRTTDYKKYLVAIVIYLIDFMSRVRPLLNIVQERNDCLKAFDDAWKEGNFMGWGAEEAQHGALKNKETKHLDLSPFQSPVELQCVGMERLKMALQALGLKCGGTSQERAMRLFSTKGKTLDEIDAELFAGGGAKGKPNSKKATAEGSEEGKEAERQKGLAALEAQVYHFVELLSEEREATRENVQRKQARTAGEIEEDEEEAEAAAAAANASDDEIDAEVPYNPKNLPLGWDGKPIPYWLYKLHGLNINYPCEICGNQVYKGPKAFSLHFSEWRHSHGMRCLGIPNTMHFSNITKISDAIQLWKKMCEQKETEKFNSHLEEEFEDSAGNVVTRKTYEDLKRQGLL